MSAATGTVTSTSPFSPNFPGVTGNTNGTGNTPVASRRSTNSGNSGNSGTLAGAAAPMRTVTSTSPFSPNFPGVTGNTNGTGNTPVASRRSTNSGNTPSQFAFETGFLPPNLNTAGRPTAIGRDGTRRNNASTAGTFISEMAKNTLEEQALPAVAQQTMAEQAFAASLAGAAQTAAPENAGNANNVLVSKAPGWGGRILTRNQLLDRRDLVDKSQANILKTLQSRPLDNKTFRRTPVTIPGPTNDTALLNAKQIRTAVLALESATMNPIQRGNLANSYLQAACDLMREGTGRLLKAGDRQQSPECEAQLHDAVADFVAAVQFVILSRYKMTPDLKPQEDKTFQQLVKLNDLLKRADGFTFKQTAGEREDLTDYIAKLASGSVKQTIQSGGGRKKSSSLVKTKKPTATKKPAAKKK